MRRQEEKKAFVDFSKTEDGKRIFENNKSIWKNQNFLEHIQSLKNPQEIELAQIIRRYQSSFNWIQKEVEHIKAFQIRHTPTARPEDLALTFDLTEGYLWLEVLKPEKYPEEPASFVLLNHSVPRDFRRWFEKDLFDHQIETKSIMRTLKYMDNNLDKICQKIQNNIAKGVEIDPKPVAKVVPVKEKPVEKPQQKVEEKAQVKEAPQDKKVKEGAQEKTQATWTQDEQKLLEQGIVKYKDIKDAKEKWEKIASDIPGRTMSECVQRFKDCRKAAEEKKNQVEEHKGNSPRSNEEEDDEDEEDESGEEEGSEEASDNTSDENIEEQKANRKIRDYQEYETAIDSIVLAKSVRYDNVSVGALISIQVQVSCKGCNCIHEAEAVKEPDSDYLVNNDKCPKCAHKNRLVAKQELFHEHSNAICSMGSFTWDIRDLHFCEFDLTCEFCDTANRTKKIIASQPIYMECKGCFKKMQFSYMALTLNALHYGDDDDTAEDANGTDVKDIIKKMFAKKTKFEFKQGFPLPNLGGCKHYKNSNRYFRFPCCGKAYPCDDCHSKVEKHEMQLAKSMICGFCSTEQPIGDVCKKCGKAVKKIVRNTAYWEGGQGTRNATAMSRRDPHKYKGLGKTVSTKKKNQMKQKAK